MVVTYQIEVYSLGMLCGSDDTKAITCECLGIEF